MVEAAGVELCNLLILRKLLVLQEARSAKKGTLPGRRYKNRTNLVLDAILLVRLRLGTNQQPETTFYWMLR